MSGESPGLGQDDDLADLIEVGTDIAGAAAGAALGLATAGAGGAILGAAAGPGLAYPLRRIASEVRSRFLSRREQVRIGAALAYAVEETDRRLGLGQQPRADGFFSDEDSQGRTTAEEIVEATLLAAQREHEERKIRYQGRLLAGIAFDATIGRTEANQLVRIAEDLSYTQLLLLQLLARPGAATRETDYRGSDQLAMELVHVLSETLDLYNRGLINNGGDVMFGLTDLHPAKATTQGIGIQLLRLMGLETIDDAAELNRLTQLLSRDPRT